jgi:Fe2+ or Zn2+ uptake regulation protein
MASSLENGFQQLCHQKQLAVTHQRLVLYRALMQMPDHPNPEQVFERVRLELPSISLATVYKTLHLFLETGIIREVSPHHGSLRIEPNATRHHHFICLQCHAITDLACSQVDESPLKNSVPGA